MTTPPTADSPTPERHPRTAAPNAAAQDAARLLRKLTPREAQTLAHLAAGHDLTRTAAALGITPATARGHLHRAMRKLGVTTEAEAVALGTEQKAPETDGRQQPAVVGGGGPTPGRPSDLTAAPGKASGPVHSASGPDPAVADRPRRTPVLGGGTKPAGEDDASGASGAGAGPSRAKAAARPSARTGTAGSGPARGGTPAEAAPKRRANAAAAAGRPGTADAATPGGAAERRAADSGTAPANRKERAAAPATEQHAPAATRADAGTRSGRTTAADARSGRTEAASEPHAPGDTETDAAHSTTRSDRTTAADTDERAEAMAKQSTAPDGAADARPTAVPKGRAAGEPAAGRARPAAGSFEELYEAAHTRLVQQVFLLTACRHRAVHCVRLAFGDARRRWGRVAATGDPEGWVRARASELALSPWHRGGPRRAHAWQLPHRRIKVRPADESQAVLPDHDRLTDRDRALLKALKRLSRPQRRALVLHDGLGLPAAAVAVEVESSRTAAEARVWAARTALAGWVPDLVGPDPAAPDFADGLSRLLHRAAVRGAPAPHRPPVPVLRARYRLWTASRTGAAALLTVAVGGAALATLAGVRPAVLTRPPEPPAPALCVPASDAPVEPGVPLLPGGSPNVVSSLWCSPAPGLEAVLVEPESQAQAAARWMLTPQDGRGAAAPPPQGPVACPPLTTHPCARGPVLR
ncbi:LuxR C-terminal-related transcriptional regulator [Streptomyces rubellomurinus]|uniref:LuxR C-terminal-related transcriptional regulator n=1 Tax=Streptomyces rubellomurinus (strain ATCC 31215) TaxID=359131 RepID=UPI0006989F22|nr:LuxR C-terminal-related transcriptional regulator [Streptomyces rubellomurinus]